MISATFTGMIINSFENSLAASIVLTAFIPMLMGTAGNSGSQSSVTIIRSLSLGEIEFKDIFMVIFKESRVSILCGVTLAVANFAKMLLIDNLLLHNPDVTVMISLVVSLTLILTVFFAKIVGCVLPMLLAKIGFDPAVVASPFITTILDALCLFIYFEIATSILHI